MSFRVILSQEIGPCPSKHPLVPGKSPGNLRKILGKRFPKKFPENSREKCWSRKSVEKFQENSGNLEPWNSTKKSQKNPRNALTILHCSSVIRSYLSSIFVDFHFLWDFVGFCGFFWDLRFPRKISSNPKKNYLENFPQISQGKWVHSHSGSRFLLKILEVLK